MRSEPTSRPCVRGGFTMIEMLVVIVVLAILVSLVGAVWAKVSYAQKRALTEAVMKNLRLAIEEFAADDPLHMRYKSSFGPYPPYQLRDRSNAKDEVGAALEPKKTKNTDTLTNRLKRDLLGGSSNGVIEIADPDRNHDIRALYTYLRVFNDDALSRIPDRFLKPLPSSKDFEYVNTVDQANAQNNIGVLGVYDGWGVPLDYMLYVKVEWLSDARGQMALRITQRIPVIRSRGVPKEKYEAEETEAESDPKNWIFSSPLPQPRADVDWKTGQMQSPGPSKSGWARVVGLGERYGYYPDLGPKGDK